MEFFFIPPNHKKNPPKKTKIISQGIYCCFFIFPQTKKKAKIDQKNVSQEIYCCFFIFSQTKTKKSKKKTKKMFSNVGGNKNIGDWSERFLAF